MSGAPGVDICADDAYDCLRSFAQGFGFWSSDSAPPVRKWWPSAEHYFQAGKFLEPELQEQIRRALEPGVAKHLGRTLGPLRPDWDDVKRHRLRRALTEKFWAHSSARAVLCSIPPSRRIIFGNTADNFFGTGPDGHGLNVMGEELMILREFFAEHAKRQQVLVTVAEIGEPFDPQSALVDLTGASPTQVVSLIAEVLGVLEESLAEVSFVYEDGFERVELASFQSGNELHSFLATNAGDCKVEVRFAEMAIVTLWNGTDDSYLARTEVLHLGRSAAFLRCRLESLLPILQHADFRPEAAFTVDGGPAQALEEVAMPEICRAAAASADVLICGHYELPGHLPARPIPEADPPKVIPGVHSGLSAAQLCDRIGGLLWGCALGDAVGLSTEFMEKADAMRAYPDPTQLSPACRVEDKHRMRWAPGDWTDDTDQMVLLLDAVVAGNGVLQEDAFAKGLKAWSRRGFPELGDSSGLGIGQTVRSVLEHHAFDVAPRVAADVVWRESGCTLAANGAIMRCAAAALGCFWDEAVVRHNATTSAAITHADPRCLTSCVCVALLLASLLTGHGTETLEQRRELLLSVTLQAGCHLDGGDLDELFQHVEVKSSGLGDLKLGSGGIGYTYKPLGAAAWAFLHADCFKEAIQAIAMEAGDADSNAAVAGAVLGARLGYERLPQDWLQELPAAQVAWFHAKITSCLAMLGLE